jgi:hypothetical protein
VRRGRTLVLAAALGSTACALVLGIDDLPLRPEVDAGGDAGDEASTGDAACKPDPKQGCRSCAHDFCDDFDDDAEAPFARWLSPLGANPFRKGDASVVVDEGGLSTPSSSLTLASSTAEQVYAIALHSLDHGVLHPGRPFVGVKYAFYMRFERLSLPGTTGGPLPDAGTAYVGAILRVLALKPAGAALLVNERGVHLAVATDVISGSGEPAVARLFEGKVLDIADNWVRVEMLVADRERAVAMGYTSCASQPPGPVAASMLSLPEYQGCLPFPAAFGDISWAATPTIDVGAGAFAEADLVVRHDNVSVDFLP